MGHVVLLDELAVIAVLAVVVTVVLSRLRLPAVAGLLAAGAIMGPHGLALVTSVEDIEVLAEIGVVLLLFTIGLEFSLRRLRNILRRVALGGLLQVALTAAAVGGIAVAAGEPIGRGVFFGFVFSMSSTAIVLRALTERRELDAPHGRFIVGTLIFQDLCIVPMVLVIPLLGTAGIEEGALFGISVALGKAALVVVGTVTLSRFALPTLLAWVDASRSREIFLLAILGTCIGTAWLTSLAGLSLALGAFLGGVVVADTEYGHRATGDILPLRDAFVSVFFVSLGMLFDVRIVAAEPMLVLLLLAGFLVLKGGLATAAALAMRFPARAAWLAGVGLAQFGEFGFVLVRLGRDEGLIDAAVEAPLFAAGIASMFLTPLLVRLAPHVTAGERLLAPLERLIGVRGIGAPEGVAGEAARRDHVVIVGFGLAGRFSARSLLSCDVACVGIESNVDNVREARAAGLPVFYGDATSEEALRHAGLEAARLVVLLINDPQAAERVVDTARRVAPTVPILMRTRYFKERDALFALGAHDVVAEEVEGAVESIVRMLRWLEVPRNVIEQNIRQLRSETQTSDRRLTAPRRTLADLRGLDDLKIESVVVRPDSAVVGATVDGLRLRSRTGALAVGVRRDGRLLGQPDPDAAFLVGDIVYLVGTGEAIQAALQLFDGDPEASAPSD